MLAKQSLSPVGRARGTIVALHGLMESGQCLQRAASRWSTSGWLAHSLDLRGHGTSPRWEPSQLDDHSGDLMVADVIATIAEIPTAGPLVVFGHSAGAAVAAGLVQHELPLTALLLEDPFWRLPVTHQQDDDVARRTATMLHRWQQTPITELAAAADPRWSPDEALLWARAKHHVQPDIVAHGTVIPTTDWPDLLDFARERAIAVDVITGTEQVGMSQDHQRIIDNRGGRTLVVDGATHFVQRTARSQFDEWADQALDRQAA